MLDEIFERFAAKSPITVMAHLGLERVLDPSWLDEVFEEYREQERAPPTMWPRCFP